MVQADIWLTERRQRNMLGEAWDRSQAQIEVIASEVCNAGNAGNAARIGVMPFVRHLELREAPRSTLTTGHDLLVRLHGPCHSVRVHLGVEGLHGLLHECSVKTLLLSHRTILVGQKKRLEIYHLFPQLGDLRCQGVVFAAEQLDLGLEVCKPLLLALSTFQSRNPDGMVSWFPVRICGANLPVPFKEILALLFVGHLGF